MKVAFRIFLMIYALSSLGCVTKPTNENSDLLSKVHSIPLGSNESLLISTLGAPDKIEEEGAERQWIYTISHNGISVPKLIFWLNHDRQLVYKHINLFKETNDDFKLADVENRIGRPTLVAAPLRRGHSIPSSKSLKDGHLGVTVEVNTTHSDEVISIGWGKPWNKKALASE